MKLTEVIGITTRNMHVKFEAVWRSYNFWRKNAYSAGPSKQDEILTFTQCSQKFMKFTEFIGITTRNMHVKFEAVRRSYNFWRKNAYSAGPSKQDEILTFTQFSPKFMKLTEVIGITTRNMHVKFETVRRSYNFWRKKAYSAEPSKQDEILTFSQSSPKFMKLTEFIEITTRNMHVKFEAVWISYNFWQKMPTALDIWDRMKFWLFLNVFQNSWNLQELLESPPETCMWNLRQFGEVTIFDGKIPTAPDLQNRMKFWLFSMFSKIHEIYRTYWNHHQKHACEIWGSSEKLQFLTEKCLQRRTFKTGWNFDFFSMFSKIHETYRSFWNHHQKHACEIWGSSEKLQFLTEKCLQRLTFKTGWSFDFSQCSQKFMKFTEFIGSTTRNMHVKFEAVRRSYNFWRKNAYSAGPSKHYEVLTFSQCSKKFMKVTEFIGITTRNMHVKFEAVRRSYNFWRKNAYSAGPSEQDEALTFSQCSPKFMKFTEFIGITTRNMHGKFEAVWRCYNFWGKNAYSAEPSKQDEILTFTQFSPKFMKLTEVIGITTRNMHVKFETVRRSYNFWRKNAYSAGPSKQDEILTFSQSSPKFMKLTEFNDITTRNMHVKFEAVWISYNFWQKMPTAPDIWDRMKFWLFLNVLQNSWNLQELLESPPETCMWNLRQFGEVTIFDGKMPTAPDLQNRMKFWLFSMFSKIHEIYRIYWNHHQKHACEIWGSSEKLQFLTEKCLQRRTFKTGWNFDFFSMISKIHETYRSFWNHHQKHACEIWGSSEKLQFLTEKCLQRRTFKTGWSFDFSQCSQKFMKFTEFIGSTTRNMHVKFEAVRRSYKFLTEKCLQRRTFKTLWSFDIFSMF